MDLEQRLKKRHKIISNIEFYIKESVYYRNNNCFFEDDKKIIVCNVKQENNKSKIL